MKRITKKTWADFQNILELNIGLGLLYLGPILTREELVKFWDDLEL